MNKNKFCDKQYLTKVKISVLVDSLTQLLINKEEPKCNVSSFRTEGNRLLTFHDIIVKLSGMLKSLILLTIPYCVFSSKICQTFYDV